MHDISDLWSLPWHTLQHSLAESYGAEPPVCVPANKAAPIAATRVGSWLARARSVTAQAPQQKR